MQSDSSAQSMSRKQRVGRLLEAASAGLYEREEAVRLSFLAAAAGDSVFMLGPPGVAKSLVARRLKHCFSGAKSFEYLMGRFSTPEELFGPISISKLKNEDTYERLVDAYLPGADVAFLDEIWKASPPIQNSLLTAINEKLFRNGEREIAIPLKALIAASNELPPDSQGLEALWDRFLVRLFVDSISEEAGFRAMVRDPGDAYRHVVPAELQVSAEEWMLWRKQIAAVEVPDAVLDLIEHIRRAINRRNAKETAENPADGKRVPPMYVSDRRWKKAVALLRTSAYLDGRDSVDIVDCLLIRHCIWSRAEEREECRLIVENAVRDRSYSGSYPMDSLRGCVADLDAEVESALFETKDYFQPQTREGHYWVRRDAQAVEPKAQGYSGWRLPIAPVDSCGTKEFTSMSANNGSLQVRRRDDGQFEINPNGASFILPLEGNLVNRRVQKAAASPVERNRWDKSRNAIHVELETVDEAIKRHRGAIASIVESHPFVQRNEAVLAYENLAAMTRELRKLEVDLDRIGKAYGA